MNSFGTLKNLNFFNIVVNFSKEGGGSTSENQ